MKKWKQPSRVLIVLGSILSVLFYPHLSFSKEYILCGRDAEITAVNPTETSSEDPCTGSVQLQGISYECTQPKEVESLVRGFLSELGKNGRKYCESFCKKRSTSKIKCRGNFISPDKCGFTIPAKSAQSFGDTMYPPCNPKCGGTAFAYCSIYHASYLKTVPDMLEGKPANCFCKTE